MAKAYSQAHAPDLALVLTELGLPPGGEAGLPNAYLAARHVPSRSRRVTVMPNNNSLSNQSMSSMKYTLLFEHRGCRNTIPDKDELSRRIREVMANQQWSISGEPLVTQEVVHVVNQQLQLVAKNALSGAFIPLHYFLKCT